jgi:hypothetical protein
VSQFRSLTRGALVVVAVGAALLSAGCSPAERASEKSPAEPTYSAPPAPPASAAPGAPPAAAPAGGTGGGAPAGAPAPAGAKVSANNASEEEIFAALSRAGVPNPAQWTDEVIEYRPYPPNDPNLGKLRQNLAKYNPAPGVVDKIVSALSP